jgi:hypothetical protein
MTRTECYQSSLVPYNIVVLFSLTPRGLYLNVYYKDFLRVAVGMKEKSICIIFIM